MIVRTVLFAVTAAAIGLGLFGTIVYRFAVAVENQPDPLAGGYAYE